ncbi:hypothetical protein LINGRAHAP2_LOCUS2186 [Linum grandiflorum]
MVVIYSSRGPAGWLGMVLPSPLLLIIGYQPRHLPHLCHFP